MSAYLMHHGIKGQRWGVRRTPKQLGHKTYKKDVEAYGQKGAERIYKRINEKHMTRKKAERREVAREVATSLATSLGLTVAGDMILNKAIFGVSITELLYRKAKHDAANYFVERGKQKAARELMPKLNSVNIDSIVLDQNDYSIK